MWLVTLCTRHREWAGKTSYLSRPLPPGKSVTRDGGKERKMVMSRHGELQISPLLHPSACASLAWTRHGCCFGCHNWYRGPMLESIPLFVGEKSFYLHHQPPKKKLNTYVKTFLWETPTGESKNPEILKMVKGNSNVYLSSWEPIQTNPNPKLLCFLPPVID